MVIVLLLRNLLGRVFLLFEGSVLCGSAPAEQVGIAERGLIREGYFADLVVFDPATIIDNATFKDPNLLASGIDRVWVNGQLVYRDRQTTGTLPGRPLRRITAAD